VGWALAITVAGALLLWLPPLWDQWRGTNNLGLVADWFTRAEEGTATLTEGARVVLGQLAVLPDWLTGERRPNGINGETTLRTVTRIPWLLVPFAAAVVVAWRKQWKAELTLAAVTALLLVVSFVSVSRTIGIMYEYRLLWLWPLALLVPVTTVWVGWRLVSEHFDGTERRLLVPGALVLLAVAAIVGSLLAFDDTDRSFVASEIDPVAQRVVDDLGTDEPVTLASRSATGEGMLQGLLLALEKRGLDARVESDRAHRFGEHRVGPGTPLLVLADEDLDGLRPGPDLELVAYAGPVPYPRRLALGRVVAAERERLLAARAAGRLDAAAFTRAFTAAHVPGSALAVYRDRAAAP
jgi:hypothetical protein